MRTAKEYFNLFLNLIIMAFMMIFFHYLERIDLWIFLFVIVFYSILMFSLLSHRVKKKIFVFIPTIALCLMLCVYIGMVFIDINRELLNQYGILAIMLFFLMIQSFFIARSYVLASIHQSKHFIKMILFQLIVILLNLYSKWVTYFSFKDKVFFALLILILGFFIFEIRKHLEKYVSKKTVDLFIYGIHLLCMVLYLFIDHSHALTFLTILSLWVSICCLFSAHFMFDKFVFYEVN